MLAFEAYHWSSLVSHLSLSLVLPAIRVDPFSLRSFPQFYSPCFLFGLYFSSSLLFYSRLERGPERGPLGWLPCNHFRRHYQPVLLFRASGIKGGE